MSVSSGLRPISRATTADQVAEQIQALIVNGTWKPGDRIPSERDLAEQLGISRGSVREALSVLEAMGWVDIRPGDGTRVRKTNGFAPSTMSHSMFRNTVDLGEIWEARKLIEPQTAYLAAERCDEADLQEMESILQRMEDLVELGQPEQSLVLNTDFHLAIAIASGNKVLSHFAQILRDLQEFIMAPYKAPDLSLERARKVVREHREIAKAIRAGNGRDAEEAVYKHLMDSWMARLLPGDNAADNAG